MIQLSVVCGRAVPAVALLEHNSATVAFKDTEECCGKHDGYRVIILM